MFDELFWEDLILIGMIGRDFWIHRVFEVFHGTEVQDPSSLRFHQRETSNMAPKRKAAEPKEKKEVPAKREKKAKVEAKEEVKEEEEVKVEAPAPAPKSAKKGSADAAGTIEVVLERW
jgi:hypothetical protein